MLRLHLLTGGLGNAKVAGMQDVDTDPIVKKAIDAGGGPAAFAKLLGIQAPSLYSWKRVPAERVPMVEAVTGIPRHELRPDLYDTPAPASAAA